MARKLQEPKLKLTGSENLHQNLFELIWNANKTVKTSYSDTCFFAV